MHTLLKYSPRSVTIHGIQYAKDAVICVNRISDFESEELFLFIQLDAIHIFDDNKVFIGHLLLIEEYLEHIRAYKVTPKDTVWIGSYDDFYLHGILHLKLQHRVLYLIEKDRLPE